MDDLNEKENIGDIKRERTLRIFFYVLIMAIFVLAMWLFYTKLYSATRDNIIESGRISAIESSNMIDKCMSASLDTLKLAAYTVDNMIRNDRNQKEIFDYLTDQTIAVADSLIADTTGVYGYIRGEYMDGSGWVPDESYDATKRPWYIDAMAGAGRLVVVDPYLDLDTGTVMITLTKTLCDAKSVIGIDISMNDLQTIVEDHASKENSAAQFIVNGKGVIIAHSDKEQNGKDISENTDPVSQYVSSMISTYKSGYSNIRYDGRDYIVYVVPLENEWVCVSVMDATEDFSSLRILLISTIAISLLMISILGILATRSEKKSRKLRESAMQTRHALAANEAKTAFLSNMSHEIRTPINVILGMNEMILREESNDRILRYSENIRGAGNSLLGIINDVLDFSKIEAGKIEIIPVEYDVSSVINDLVNMVHTRAEEKGLALQLNISPEIPKILFGDEVRIKQIIMNILSNAVKYTEKGSITFSIGCRKMHTDTDGVLISVSVKDTGIGIRKADINRLFTKFERIEEERNRNIEGTGLGLNITKSLLELMGSTLSVDSVYGEGSTFSFELSQKVVNWEPVGDYEASYRAHMRSRGKYKERFTAEQASVLVVDDNPMNLMVFESLIKQTKINTDIANSGDEGIELSKNNRYDILFLDHMMPNKDGIETLKEIRLDDGNPNKATPAVCLTANAISGAREKYMNAGFDGYLTKPIDPDRLEELLAELLPDDMITMTEPDSTEMPVMIAEGAEEFIPKEIEALDGDLIEVDTGLKNSASAGTYLSVLKVFFTSADDQSGELAGFFENEDIRNYTIKVHAIKSSAKLIGATGFAIKAQMLENAGKNGDIDYIRENHGQFMKEYMLIKELLSKVFDEKESGNKKPEADDGIMREAYEGIKAAAAAMDCEMLESIFDEMEKHDLPAGEHGLFSELKAASEKYDYDRILDLLSGR
ncbi:MAG: response regulator [Lachnospiraceae bacterium]|nr:response regulator [Lachnospiraceae bacterium]